MTAADDAPTVRDPLAVLRERIEETRRRYGFPDIEDRYPGALLEAFLLRDAIALEAQAKDAEEMEGSPSYHWYYRAQEERERAEAAEAEVARLRDGVREIVAWGENFGVAATWLDDARALLAEDGAA